MPPKEMKNDTEETIFVQKYFLFIAIALLILVGIGGAGGTYYYYNQANELKLNPQKTAQEETAALIKRVSQLIVLPTDEQPTIATVADPAKLKDQPFFAQAKVGDRVLIYTNARKAVLYNPTTNKIVEVAPLNIGSAPQTAGAATGTK